MSNLANTLRMYAEDMHSATGYNERSSAMSKAADMIEKFENMSACEACATIPSVMEYVQQLEQECGTLAAQNEGMREAIELYFKQYPHMMKGYILDAINSPNLAAEVLKRRDATVESKLLRGLVSGANGGKDGRITCKDLLDMVAEIEKETDR